MHVVAVRDAMTCMSMPIYVRARRGYVEHSKVADMRTALNAQRNKKAQSFIDKWRRSSAAVTFQAWKTWTQKNRGKKKDILGELCRMC